MQIEKFDKTMQKQVEIFLQKCFFALGWDYNPQNRHADIADIEGSYMKNGCFWCMFDNDTIIGTIAVRCIDKENRTLELKRMFILPEYQRRGCATALLKVALDYAKEQKYCSICLDTRSDLVKAQQFYRKNGFYQIEKYNNNEYADIYFSLSLQ